MTKTIKQIRKANKNGGALLDITWSQRLWSAATAVGGMKSGGRWIGKGKGKAVSYCRQHLDRLGPAVEIGSRRARGGPGAGLATSEEAGPSDGTEVQAQVRASEMTPSLPPRPSVASSLLEQEAGDRSYLWRPSLV